MTLLKKCDQYYETHKIYSNLTINHYVFNSTLFQETFSLTNTVLSYGTPLSTLLFRPQIARDVINCAQIGLIIYEGKLLGTFW